LLKPTSTGLSLRQNLKSSPISPSASSKASTGQKHSGRGR
jgi:hypothetical protein